MFIVGGVVDDDDDGGCLFHGLVKNGDGAGGRGGGNRSVGSGAWTRCLVGVAALARGTLAFVGCKSATAAEAAAAAGLLADVVVDFVDFDAADAAAVVIDGLLSCQLHSHGDSSAADDCCGRCCCF